MTSRIFAIVLTLFLISNGVPHALRADEPAPLTLSSPAFQQDGDIPAKHTCEGENVSPSLHWSRVPKPAQSIALIMDDPDAPSGTWTHWLLFNLPPTIDVLPMDMPALKGLANGEQQGKNDFGNIGYEGPCPPSGTHRYHFKIVALDTAVPLQGGASKQELEQAMEGHVLAKGELVGKYTKRSKE